MFDCIIIGGGITGLSAAWEFDRTQPNLSYCLLEAANYWGGKVVSTTIDAEGKQFLVDGGPDTLVTRKPETWALTEEAGLLDEVIRPESETKNIYVLDDGRVLPIPLSPGLFFTTPLLTWRGRLRLMAEPFQPARRDDEDESLADFVTRRLGREALEKFIGPVLGGIYNTDPSHQSIMVASPIMRSMEKESGSLIKATFQRMRKRDKSHAPRPRFINYRHGMQQLPDSMAAALKGNLRLNTRVVAINRLANGYSVLLSGGETLEAETLILATLANVSAGLLETVAPQTAAQLRKIAHENSGTVSLVYRESDLPTKPQVNGLMIPRREQRAIDAMTVTSRKMPVRSHPGYALLRVFFGGAKPALIDLSDTDLLEAVTGELRELLGIHGKPLAHAIFRWESGFPQARVNHLKLVDAIETSLPAGIHLAGSSYRGIAVPDCIRQGRDAARKAIAEREKQHASLIVE